MIQQFRDDFHLMLRKRLGYIPWLEKKSYKMSELIYEERHYPRKLITSRKKLIRVITEEQVCDNKLIDLVFKSLIRSEIRFVSRFIPQRSHEERLTGNLVSEMSNSIELIKNLFKTISMEEYGEKKQIDFFYYDLSRGGKLEKITGADLALGLIIDLPDYPKSFKSFVFQAKKINNSAQLDLTQFKTLTKNFRDNSAYLFYDMDTRTLNSPFVLSTDDYTMKYNADEAASNQRKSFSLNIKDVYDGLPLSAFMIYSLLEDAKLGHNHSSICTLIDFFRRSNIDFDGRLAILSIGNEIRININNDGGLEFE